VEAHPIPVYAHRLSVPRLKRDENFLQKRVEFFQKLYSEMGCGEAGEKQVEYLKKAIKTNRHQAIDADIHNIENLSVQPFEIIEIPGHAVDQIALYNPQQKVVIVGDLLIDHISSNALIEPDENSNRIKSLLIHEASLKKIHQLDMETVYPGHGKIINAPYELIQKRITGIETKARKFFTLLKNNRLTASELAQLYYKEVYKKQFALVMSETIGHLDYLEEKGKISKEFKDGVWQYFVKNSYCKSF
jgi:glyoxylase-like metal-dependent hydrolase (beta-lactamase superfamily II)